MNTSASKTCTKCRGEFPKTSFSRDRGKRDGLSVHCKLCCSDRLSAWLAHNADKNRERRAAYRLKTKEHKKRYDADRRERLADQLREYDRNRYQLEKVARISRYRAYYLENRERILEVNRAYRAINRESINASARSDRAKVKEKRARRRASINRAVPKWSDKSAIAEIYRECELISAATGVEHQVDHVVPIRSKIVCGLHWHGNLQVIPKADNLQKSNLTWPDMP